MTQQLKTRSPKGVKESPAQTTPSEAGSIVAVTYRIPEGLRDDLGLLATLSGESVNGLVIAALTRAVNDGLRTPEVRDRLSAVLARLESEAC